MILYKTQLALAEPPSNKRLLNLRERRVLPFINEIRLSAPASNRTARYVMIKHPKMALNHDKPRSMQSIRHGRHRDLEPSWNAQRV